MAEKSATVRARLEPELKEETERILNQLGLTTTEAIRLFFKQVQLQRRLPFPLKLPNNETQEALNDAYNRRDLTSRNKTEELFEDLGI